jgi:hypothetical protein
MSDRNIVHIDQIGRGFVWGLELDPGTGSAILGTGEFAHSLLRAYILWRDSGIRLVPMTAILHSQLRSGQEPSPDAWFEQS